jgi:uncharacterized membrane protein
MNSLSLLLYGISTLLQLQNFLIVVIFALIAFTVIFGFLYAVAADNDDDTTKQATWLKRTLTATFIAGFMLVFLPSQKFLVLIAASEVGEMAYNQPAVQNSLNQLGGLSSDAVNLLKLYIESESKKFLEEMKPSEKK